MKGRARGERARARGHREGGADARARLRPRPLRRQRRRRARGRRAARGCSRRPGSGSTAPTATRRGCAELFRGADVVHVTRAGVAEPLVPGRVRAAGVEVLVESNVFGAVDASADEAPLRLPPLPVARCARCATASGSGSTGPAFHDRHRVSHWPVDIARLRELAPEPAEAKRRLGLDPDRPVAGRIGRANDRKWRNLIVDMIPPLLRARARDAGRARRADAARSSRRLDRLGVLERRAHLRPDRRRGRAGGVLRRLRRLLHRGRDRRVAQLRDRGGDVPRASRSSPARRRGWTTPRSSRSTRASRATSPTTREPFAEAVASLVVDDAERARFGRAAAAKSDAALRRRAADPPARAALRGAARAGAPRPGRVDARRRPRSTSSPPSTSAASPPAFRPLTPAEQREERRERLRERATLGGPRGPLQPESRRPALRGRRRTGAPAGGGNEQSPSPRVSVIVVAPELNEYGRRCLAALLELDEEVEIIFVPDEIPGELRSSDRCARLRRGPHHRRQAPACARARPRRVRRADRRRRLPAPELAAGRGRDDGRGAVDLCRRRADPDAARRHRARAPRRPRLRLAARLGAAPLALRDHRRRPTSRTPRA